MISTVGERPRIHCRSRNSGAISEARIDESVRRILKNKFDLGLFEEPFVDETAISELVNLPEYTALGMQAQRNAVVLLDNETAQLPLAAKTRIFVDGLEPSVAANYGTVVNTPEEADVVLLFLNTVFNGTQPAGTDRTLDKMLASRFPDTNLAFNDEILAKAKSYSEVSQLVTLVRSKSAGRSDRAQRYEQRLGRDVWCVG